MTTQRKPVEPKATTQPQASEALATTKIAKSRHKTQAKSLHEYRQFMLMALGGARNFVTHPEQTPVIVANTANVRRVISLFPKAHVSIKYVPNNRTPGMTAKLTLTKAAYDLFKDIGPDMMEKIAELEASSPGAFVYAPINPKGALGNLFAAELDCMARLEAELKEEEKTTDTNPGSK